eukprot:XP_001710307.1 Hypothetical protein GL50803_31241 [Giardia lamblia ATCC 50803]
MHSSAPRVPTLFRYGCVTSKGRCGYRTPPQGRQCDGDIDKHPKHFLFKKVSKKLSAYVHLCSPSGDPGMTLQHLVLDLSQHAFEISYASCLV